MGLSASHSGRSAIFDDRTAHDSDVGIHRMLPDYRSHRDLATGLRSAIESDFENAAIT